MQVKGVVGHSECLSLRRGGNVEVQQMKQFTTPTRELVIVNLLSADCCESAVWANGLVLLHNTTTSHLLRSTD